MKGVARLLTEDECSPAYDGDDDDEHTGHRTAFLISREHALTAAHNVVDLDPSQLWLRFPLRTQPQRFRYIRTNGVTLDRESDIAVLHLDVRHVRGYNDPAGRPGGRIRTSAIPTVRVARRRTPMLGAAVTHGYPLRRDRPSDPTGTTMIGRVRGSTTLPTGFPALDCWFDGLAAGRPISPLGFSGAPIVRRVLGIGPRTAVGLLSGTQLDESAHFAAGGGVKAADLRTAVDEVPGLGDAVRRGRAERTRLPRLFAITLTTAVTVFVAMSLAIPTTPHPPAPEPVPDRAVVALPAICDVTSLPAKIEFTPPSLGDQFVYTVSSQQNSRPLTIGPGGWVMQPFVATTPFIGGMGAVPSVSRGQAHHLLYEILRPPGDVVWRSDAIVDDTNKDAPVFGDMPRPVPVEVGAVYLMRVTNVSDGDVAVYVHRPDDGDAVPYNRTACQRPNGNAPPQSAPRGMVLSGAINGRDGP